MATKDGMDWVKCQRLYERGMTIAKLAKRFPEVSRQAIDQMAKRASWSKSAQHTDLSTVQFPKLVDKLKYSDAKAKVILEAMRHGASKLVASGLAKITHQTLGNWILEDPLFAEAITEAQAAHVNDMKGHMVAAAPRDWRAADRLLQVHEFTKAEHGQSQGQGQVNVVININRPPIEGQPGDNATVIEYESQEAPELPEEA